ncbi:Ubiquitin fusion degradation protein 1 [Spraguea lophii 42_110]|uniref:Ubiquitin fusion degradation protein 1 n=1 Tax=Spraguea lophii (strain 42_110) TaxID=1358809 RepID=S7XL13_SPRLO|nr:Ubiquitin fusion degradation protein 1 [Spraguea lophii 42_110]
MHFIKLSFCPMLFGLFGSNSIPSSWQLFPQKFKKGDPNNFGGKIILPQIVIEDLVAAQITPPYTFELSHSGGEFKSCCGVIEFTSNMDTVILPSWLYHQLNITDLTVLTVKYKIFCKGTFVRFLPHSTSFLEIESPKSELENSLRNYQVLTIGDEIYCNFEEHEPIRFTVTEMDRGLSSIYIVDTDLSVDFLPPLGYEEKVEREKSAKRFIERIKKDGEEYDVVKMKENGLYFGIYNK